MDVTNIAAAATQLATQKDADQINIIVLKKALDSQATAAADLIAALPPAPAAPATSSLGHHINTTA
jgi:hypothetical protein